MWASALLGVVLVGCGGAGPTPQIVYVTPAPTPTPTLGSGTEITPQPTTEVTPEPEPTQAGEASVQIVRTTLVRWIDVLGDANVQVVVEVKNTGAGWADMYTSSDLTLFAQDGSVTTTGTIYYGFPRYLAPGDTGYLLDDESETGGKVTDYAKADVSVQFTSVDGPGVVLKISNTKIKTGYFGDGVDVTGLVKNTSTDAVGSAVVAAILFDSTGKSIGYNWVIVDNIGAGQSKGFVLSGQRDLKLSSVSKAILYAYSTD
jgi:microcompartment protein CcmK/EutM